MSSPDAAQVESALQGVTALIERTNDAVRAGNPEAIVPPELVQKVLELGVRLYSFEAQAGRPLAAFAPGHGVAATDVMICSTGMLTAVNIQLFELGMWQMWGKG